MRPLLVILLDEGVEARLLLQSTFAAAGLVASCLQREMHPLMPAVLLRMAGLDALDLNPETEPPDRQFAEPVDRMGGRERHAVVGPDHPRQPKFLEGALEHREGEFLLRRRAGLHRSAGSGWRSR